MLSPARIALRLPRPSLHTAPRLVRPIATMSGKSPPRKPPHSPFHRPPSGAVPAPSPCDDTTADPGAAPKDTRPLVLSGPSGVGKGTLYNLLFARHPDAFALSVSHTTRSPRAGESDGVHYHFVPMQDFEDLISDSGFVEHAKFGGNRYGTSKKTIEEQTAKGRVVLLDIEMEVRCPLSTPLHPISLFRAQCYHVRSLRSQRQDADGNNRASSKSRPPASTRATSSSRPPRRTPSRSACAVAAPRPRPASRSASPRQRSSSSTPRPPACTTSSSSTTTSRRRIRSLTSLFTGRTEGWGTSG